MNSAAFLVSKSDARDSGIINKHDKGLGDTVCELTSVLSNS